MPIPVPLQLGTAAAARPSAISCRGGAFATEIENAALPTKALPALTTGIPESSRRAGTRQGAIGHGSDLGGHEPAIVGEPTLDRRHGQIEIAIGVEIGRSEPGVERDGRVGERGRRAEPARSVPEGGDDRRGVGDHTDRSQHLPDDVSIAVSVDVEDLKLAAVGAGSD
jgi:hypothetical protein